MARVLMRAIFHYKPKKKTHTQLVPTHCIRVTTLMSMRNKIIITTTVVNRDTPAAFGRNDIVYRVFSLLAPAQVGNTNNDNNTIVTIIRHSRAVYCSCIVVMYRSSSWII